MSGHKIREFSAEEKKQLHLETAKTYGSGIERTNERYKINLHFNYDVETFTMNEDATSKELTNDLTKMFFHLKDHKDLCHNPYINELYNDFKYVMIKLTGKVPKKEFKPRTMSEKLGYELYLTKYHEAPTEKQLEKFLENYREEI